MASFTFIARKNYFSLNKAKGIPQKENSPALTARTAETLLEKQSLKIML